MRARRGAATLLVVLTLLVALTLAGGLYLAAVILARALDPGQHVIPLGADGAYVYLHRDNPPYWCLGDTCRPIREWPGDEEDAPPWEGPGDDE
jgi:hypothetical protein